MKKDKLQAAKVKLFELCKSTVVKLVKLGNDEDTATATVMGMLEVCKSNIGDYEFVKLILDQLVNVETQMAEGLKLEI